MHKGWSKAVFCFFVCLALTYRMMSVQAATSRSICQIQGDGFESPYDGDAVTTRGVVIADFDNASKKGFYIQDENCDGNADTSDGILVYLGVSALVVDVGDLVEVTGIVNEYYGLTEILADPANVIVTSSGNPFPTSADLNPPFDDAQSQAYFESLEGMYVSLADAKVVGPTNSSDETWVVRSDLGINRVFGDDPAGTGERICVDDGGHFEIIPEARVGDQVLGLVGVMDYAYGLFRLQLLASPTLIPASSSTEAGAESASPPITFGTFNLENLFDTVDDPLTGDTILSNTAYQRKLEKLALAIHNELDEPAILAVQEAENATVLTDLIARSEIVAPYNFVLVEGADARGIDVALLYRTDLATVTTFEQRQGCTTLVDGLGPDGNGDVINPANALTCDTNHNGIDDGNRLFSRPPLVVELSVDLNGQDETFFVIVNHWKSKGEDTDDVEYTLPRRVKQAQFVAGLAQEILAANPGANLVVLGDLNDYGDSQPLQELENSGLTNLVPRVEKSQRYTYIYEGISQVLDHVLVNPDFLKHWLAPSVVHFNADYPYSYRSQSGIPIRSSDHDSVLVEIKKLEGVYLPLVIR
jgi:predicted extracellular nuclease